MGAGAARETNWVAAFGAGVPRPRLIFPRRPTAKSEGPFFGSCGGAGWLMSAAALASMRGSGISKSAASEHRSFEVG